MLLRYMKHYYLNIVNVLSDLAPLNSLCVCVCCRSPRATNYEMSCVHSWLKSNIS